MAILGRVIGVCRHDQAETRDDHGNGNRHAPNYGCRRAANQGSWRRSGLTSWRHKSEKSYPRDRGHSRDVKTDKIPEGSCESLVVWRACRSNKGGGRLSMVSAAAQPLQNYALGRDVAIGRAICLHRRFLWRKASLAKQDEVRPNS